MLEEGIGDHGHQGMAVKAAPGAALEVVEAQFLLHLLVGLLAHPACLDGGGELREGGSDRQVGQIVFALARRPPLAHQPGLLSRHVLLALVVDALGRPIGDADGGDHSALQGFDRLSEGLARRDGDGQRRIQRPGDGHSTQESASATVEGGQEGRLMGGAHSRPRAAVSLVLPLRPRWSRTGPLHLLQEPPRPLPRQRPAAAEVVPHWRTDWRLR